MVRSADILMGILRQCEDIQADIIGIHKALHKFSQLYPDIFSCCRFGPTGISSEFDEDLENLVLDGLLVMRGEKLETLTVTPELKSKFDNEQSKKFTKSQLESIKAMGISFPKLLKKTESVRYRKLVCEEVE